jgi:hypothetical protein
MLTLFMSKIKPTQIFMELLLNKDLKDTFLREKVNGTVILNHMLKWNSFHLEKPLDMLKDHIKLTCPLLNRSKSTELKPILKFYHMLLETMHGISNIMITLISTNTWLMDQKNTLLKLTTTYLTQPILPVLRIHLRHAQLLKKSNSPMRRLLPNLKVFQLQSHGANLVLKILAMMLLPLTMLLLIQMREPVQMLLLVEMILLLQTQLLQQMPLLLLTKPKKLMFLIIKDPSNIRFKLKLKMLQSQSRRSIQRPR